MGASQRWRNASTALFLGLNCDYWAVAMAQSRRRSTRVACIWCSAVDVIASGERGRGIDGIKAHKVPRPTEAERGSVASIPCTGPARTLVNYAGVVGGKSLRAAFEVAAFKRLLNLDAIEAILGRGKRRSGPNLRIVSPNGALAATAPTTQEGLAEPLLRSGERRTKRGKDAGRPNSSAIWLTEDAAPRRSAAAGRGRGLCRALPAFDRDRWRDRELLRAGYATLRVPWRHAEDEPDAVLDAIRVRLAQSAQGDSRRGPKRRSPIPHLPG